MLYTAMYVTPKLYSKEYFYDIFINVSASGLVLGSLGNFFCASFKILLKKD